MATENANLGTGHLILAVEGTVLAVRVDPHRLNNQLLVLKAPAPGVGEALCAQMGIEPCGATWQGANFFLTPVKVEAFQAALPSFLARCLEVGRENDKREVEEASAAKQAEAAANIELN